MPGGSRAEPATAIEQFGIDVAMKAGNPLYFFPQCVLLSDPNDLGAAVRNGLIADFVREMNRLHLGQTVDIDWQDRSGKRLRPNAPSERSRRSGESTIWTPRRTRVSEGLPEGIFVWDWRR